MDLQNKQADQLEEVTQMVSSNYQALDSLQDPITNMLDTSQRITKRIRPRRMINFFRDSQNLVQDMKKERQGSTSSSGRGSSSGVSSNIDFYDNIEGSMEKMEERTDEYFEDLTEDKLGEDLPDMMDEFHEDQIDKIDDLDDEYSNLFNRTNDLHNFDRNIEDSFNDAKGQASSFFDTFDSKLSAMGLDSSSVSRAVGGGRSLDVGGSISESYDQSLEVMEKFRRMTGSNIEAWGEFKSNIYEDTREVNREFERFTFGIGDRMNALDSILDTGITDPSKIQAVSDSVMIMNALSRNVDLANYDFLQTQLYQLDTEGAQELTNDLTAFAASVADLRGVDPEDVFNSFDQYGRSIKAITSNNREFRRHIENLTEFGLALKTTGMAEESMSNLQDTLAGVLESGGALSDQAKNIARVTQISGNVAGLNPQQISQMLQEGRYDEVGTAYVEAIRDVFDPATMSVEEMFTRADAMGLDYGMIQDIISEDYDISEALEEVRGSRADSVESAEEAGKSVVGEYFDEAMQQTWVDMAQNTATLNPIAEYVSNISEKIGVSGGFTGFLSSFGELPFSGLLSGAGGAGIFTGLKSFFTGGGAASTGGGLLGAKGAGLGTGAGLGAKGAGLGTGAGLGAKGAGLSLGAGGLMSGLASALLPVGIISAGALAIRDTLAGDGPDNPTLKPVSYNFDDYTTETREPTESLDDEGWFSRTRDRISDWIFGPDNDTADSLDGNIQDLDDDIGTLEGSIFKLDGTVGDLYDYLDKQDRDSKLENFLNFDWSGSGFGSGFSLDTDNTIEMPTSSDSSSSATPSTSQSFMEDYSLGDISSKYESGGDIASVGNITGPYYGKFQIAKDEGTMDSFIDFMEGYDSTWAKLLRQDGPYEFDDKWRALAYEDPDKFEEIQRQFIGETHFQPAASKMEDIAGIDVSERSAALREAIWSTSVQHGVTGAGRVFQHAGINDGMSDEEIIRAIYSERGAEQGDKWFPRVEDPQTRRNIAQRFENEVVDVLAMLDNNSQGYQTGGFVKKVAGFGRGDVVPAMLEPGEFVIPKNLVQSGFKTAERAASSIKDVKNNTIQVIVNNDDVVEVIKWATYKIERAIKNTANETETQDTRRRGRDRRMNPGLEKQVNLN